MCDHGGLGRICDHGPARRAGRLPGARSTPRRGEVGPKAMQLRGVAALVRERATRAPEGAGTQRAGHSRSGSERQVDRPLSQLYPPILYLCVSRAPEVKFVSRSPC